MIGRQIPFLGICLGMQLLATVRHTRAARPPGSAGSTGEVRLPRGSARRDAYPAHRLERGRMPQRRRPLLRGVGTGPRLLLRPQLPLWSATTSEDVLAATPVLRRVRLGGRARRRSSASSSIPRRARGRASRSCATSWRCRTAAMLKVRVMPTLLFKDVGPRQGRRRSTPGAGSAARCRRSRSTTCARWTSSSSSTSRATIDGRPPDFETVDELADECFMPLTVGGGVRTVERRPARCSRSAPTRSPSTPPRSSSPTLIRGDRRSLRLAVRRRVDRRAAREPTARTRSYTHAGTAADRPGPGGARARTRRRWAPARSC